MLQFIMDIMDLLAEVTFINNIIKTTNTQEHKQIRETQENRNQNNIDENGQISTKTEGYLYTD